MLWRSRSEFSSAVNSLQPPSPLYASFDSDKSFHSLSRVNGGVVVQLVCAWRSQLQTEMGNPLAAKKDRKTKSKSREEWRRYGSARRKELVAKDEVLGGTSFEMHKKCQIERYFRIAEKVGSSAMILLFIFRCWNSTINVVLVLKAIGDFEKKCRDPKSDIEETYVVGHRLQAFLGKALPQHPNYRKSQVAQLRSKSLRQLEWLKKEMDDLALKIDEEHLNTYITMDFEPVPDDLSSSSSEGTDDESGFADISSLSVGDFNDHEWQDFTGWTLSGLASSTDAFSHVPLATETDSSLSHEVNSSHELSDTDEEKHTDVEKSSDEEIVISETENEDLVMEEPQTYVTFQDEDEGGSDSEESDLEDGPSEFFRKIASEVVSYESDSEAVDSWAQDGESHPRSCASSGTALTYDPARIAFREIMNNVSTRLDRTHVCLRNSPSRGGSNKRQGAQRSQQAPPPKSISTPILRRNEGGDQKVDSWATFSIASVRQGRNRVSASH